MPFSRRPISFSFTDTTFLLGAVQIAAASENSYPMFELVVFGVSACKLPDKVVMITALAQELGEPGLGEHEARLN